MIIEWALGEYGEWKFYVWVQQIFPIIIFKNRGQDRLTYLIRMYPLQKKMSFSFVYNFFMS